MRDGYDALPKALAKGLDVRLNTAATAIHYSPDGNSLLFYYMHGPLISLVSSLQLLKYMLAQQRAAAQAISKQTLSSYQSLLGCSSLATLHSSHRYQNGSNKPSTTLALDY